MRIKKVKKIYKVQTIVLLAFHGTDSYNKQKTNEASENYVENKLVQLKVLFSSGKTWQPLTQVILINA